MGWAFRYSNPGRGKRFFFPPKIKTASGANPASLNGYRVHFWVLSERKRHVDHPPLSSAKVKSAWSCTYFAVTPIGLCFLGMDINNFTFLPYHLQGRVTPTYPFLLFYFFLCRFAFFPLLSVFGMYLFRISAGPPTSLPEDFLNYALSSGSCLDSREIRALPGYYAA
jgi:hypothetical protein